LKRLAEVQNQLAEYDGKHEELLRLQVQLETQISEETSGLGVAVLNGDESGLEKIAALERRHGGIDRALGALAAQRAEVEKLLNPAKAAELRAEANAKRTELDELEKKTERLLRELSRLEDTEFTSCILNAQRVGTWHPAFGALANPMAWLSPDEVFPEPGRRAGEPIYARPLSRRLRDEIAMLEDEANRLDPPAPAPELPSHTFIPDPSSGLLQGAEFTGRLPY
jgi:hypothetical protein